MKIIAKLSRSKVAANKEHEVDLLVKLRAPGMPADRRRPPLCLVPVVDVSGSMEGEKLAAVRYALERLIDHLAPGDRVGIVTFDSDVHVVAPMAEVTAARKHNLLRAVRGLRSGSSTNLSGGFLEGVRLVRNATLGPELRARVILLTDGCANEGVATEPGALVSLVKEQARGVTISAFGYGDDCDQALLGEMADAGGGSYAYITNNDVVPTAFARELGGLVATYAADVRLRLEHMAGEAVEERLGDLLYEGEIPFAAGLTVPAHARATGVELATIQVRYLDERGREQAASTLVLVDFVPEEQADRADDPEIAHARDERLLREAQEAAEAAARQGDFERARAIISVMVARLREQALIDFARSTLLPCYEEREYAGTGGLRMSAMSSLKKRRRVTDCEDLPESLHTGLSRIEADMEESFKKKSSTGTPPSSGSGRSRGRR